jgi:hypothetical protein
VNLKVPAVNIKVPAVNLLLLNMLMSAYH